MKPQRNNFPPDMLALLFQPLVVVALAIAFSFLFPIVSAVRHPTVGVWFTTFYVATAVSFIGALLLFLAKLPQYRAGIFWRVGSRHLPPFHQRLYRLAFLLLVPSCIALLTLILLAPRVR